MQLDSVPHKDPQCVVVSSNGVEFLTDNTLLLSDIAFRKKKERTRKFLSLESFSLLSIVLSIYCSSQHWIFSILVLCCSLNTYFLP